MKRRAAPGRLPAVGIAVIINLPSEALPPDERTARELGRRLFEAARIASAGSRTGGSNKASVDAFLAERCERCEEGTERATVLLTAYNQWAPSCGLPSLTYRAFGDALRALGWRRKKSNVIRYLGLRLRSSRRHTAA